MAAKETKSKERKSQTYYFTVNKPNKYEADGDSQKLVQLKILDILFKRKICNLVYIRDVTRLNKDSEKQNT